MLFVFCFELSLAYYVVLFAFKFIYSILFTYVIPIQLYSYILCTMVFVKCTYWSLL
jgi:hypothetical protein